MQILSTVVLAAVAAFHVSPAQHPAREPLRVTAVVSGDTIDVETIGRVRLLGIAAPKLDRRGGASAPLAADARDRLAALVGTRWVRLEYEPAAKSSATGRSAYVLLDDGTCVNAVLVREGLARVAGRTSLSRLPELQRAEDTARRERRGIWDPLASTTGDTYTTPKSSKPKGKKKRGGGFAGI